MDNVADHIHTLLTDPEAYRKAAAEEGRIWGHHFSDDGPKAIRQADAQAALKLRPARHSRSFVSLARQNGWKFGRGLSLACGSGRAERELIGAGVCDSFVGIDVAEGAVEEARRIAAEQGLDVEYRVGDLNSVELGFEEFDLVVTQNCLHHIVKLEFLADQIACCLKPGGRVWIDDFIGETQFQWLQKRLDIVNEVLSVLPERYRNFRLHGRIMDRFERPVPGSLVSPFEAIRSAEIIPVFRERFEIEVAAERDSIMHLVAPVGSRQNYLETEDGPVIFELLMLLDRLLIENQVLPPLGGQYVMRKR
jgi:SAM-dependent methyltransferase